MQSVSKEFLLLVNISKNNFQVDLNENYDWKLFIELTIHHRLFSFIYPVICKQQEKFPEKVLKTLERLYKNNTFQMLHLCGEMDSLSKEFASAGIPLIVLKGPVLAKELYGDISLRTSSDIDVLVPITSLIQVEEMLQKEGYVKEEYIKTVLNDWKWRHHHFTYIHPQKGVKVEVHWRLNPGPNKEPSFAELWSRKRISSISQHPVYILGKEDLFFFLVTHGARHAWSRLRWLLDISKLMKHNLDWNFTSSLFKKYHYSPVGSQAVLLTSHVFSDRIHTQLEQMIKIKKGEMLAQLTVFYFENLVNLHTNPLPESVSNYHTRYLFSIMSYKQKLYYLLSLLHPFPEDAQTLPLPKSLHFLYFPLRPFLWISRKVKLG